MKLLIKDYLASLKERDELDVILPDLISDLGLNVISRPQRGTRQYGVDVAAVGRLDNDEADSVYLLSIKAGNLSRTEWDRPEQGLRTSLNEILDVYIPTILPEEHRRKPVHICICIGGDIAETVRPHITSYIRQHTNESVTFLEWNGDRLSQFILSGFLREELMPEEIRSLLRKSIALVDEPDLSYKYFSRLLRQLSDKIDNNSDEKKVLTVVRQIYICTSVMYSWCLDIDNLDAAYQSSELSALWTWNIIKGNIADENANKKYSHLFYNLIKLHISISRQYIEQKVIPHAVNTYVISAAIHAPEPICLNLKLFEILSRLSMTGIWLNYTLNSAYNNNEGAKNDIERLLDIYCVAIKKYIDNNPLLYSPLTENQCSGVVLTCYFLFIRGENTFISHWLVNMIDIISYSLAQRRSYPSVYSDYETLLYLSCENDDDSFKESTKSCIIYPSLMLIASIIDDEMLFDAVKQLKHNFLSESNFQLWFVDNTTDDCI